MNWIVAFKKSVTATFFNSVSYKILLISFFIIFLVPKQGFPNSNQFFSLIGNEERNFQEFQENCDKTAETYVKNQSFGLEKDDLLTSTNYEYKGHFNEKLKKCFLVIQITYNNKHLPRKWRRTLLLLDVYDSKEYGKFNIGTDESKMTCYVKGYTCQSESQWNSLIRPYTEDFKTMPQFKITK